MSVQFAVSTTDNIHFTGMTCFPLQFSRLARTSIRRSVALVRSGPPLETAIAPLRGRRKDRQRRRQSSLTVMNAEIEEHTSELQSHSDLVCRLLLEKKKIQKRSLSRSDYNRSSPSAAHV